ncbi:MAG: carboxymuconolactone decarboxylase family protein [Bacteriovoracaceae bacterium]|nr:carboxymuconolactone decarboxylase family protein [Bacteriovoracaceae bacterium]
MFTYHTPETAPEESRERLEQTQKGIGMIPNLHAVLAEAPVTYEAYSWLYGKFTEQSTLSPLEQQVVMMTSNYENNCHYCVPAHTFIMKSAKMSEEVIEALREGVPIQDEKLQALRVFTKELWDNRGHIGDEKLNNFLNAGYSKRQALEVLTGMASKLISNFTNGLTHTKVDPPFQSFAWTHPSKR